ncbi:MAG: DUF3634 family protein [Tepidisphaeraceae bacterium]
MQPVSQTLRGGWSALIEVVRAWRTHYVFVVRLSQDGVEITRGAVPPRLLRALCRVFEQHHIRSGWVAGVDAGGRMKLIVTGNWPIDVRQSVRNAWAKVG